MNISTRLLITVFSMILAATITACDREPSDKTLGESIDQGIEKTGDQASKVTKQLGEQSDKAGVAMDDTAITAKVKTAILAEPGLKVLQISVDTVNGVTTLTGSVDSQQNSNKAETVTLAVSGVKDVNNQLTVNPAR
jgi:osmotically-inducible protein OsmY